MSLLINGAIMFVTKYNQFFRLNFWTFRVNPMPRCVHHLMKIWRAILLTIRFQQALEARVPNLLGRWQLTFNQKVNGHVWSLSFNSAYVYKLANIQDWITINRTNRHNRSNIVNQLIFAYDSIYRISWVIKNRDISCEITSQRFSRH